MVDTYAIGHGLIGPDTNVFLIYWKRRESEKLQTLQEKDGINSIVCANNWISSFQKIE